MRRAMMGIAAGLWCAAAGAQTGSWTAWDSSLSVSRGRLVSLEGERVVLVSAAGVEEVVPETVALMRTGGAARERFGPWAWSEEWPARVTLTDGQSWEAAIVDAPDSENLELRVRRLGRVSVPLDVVRSVVLGSGGEAAPAAGGVFDSVALDNGDILRGTVLSIGREVEIEGDEGTVRVDRRSARRIDLINPPAGEPPARVWFASGSVLGARAVSGRGTISVEAVAPDGRGGQTDFGRVEVSDADLVGIEFTPGRLQAMWSLPVTRSEPEGGRRWAAPVVRAGGGELGQGTLVFPGPMSATLGLPRPGIRATGEVTLGERAGSWADCVVRIEQEGENLWEARLHAGSPSAAFSVELGAERALTVRVLPGAYGPVQDRVELRLGWVLLAAE